MARHVPVKFLDKLREAQVVLDVAATDAGRHYDFGREVLPGVRVIRSEVRGRPVVFSLWTNERDVAEICGDAAVPATAALLAIDGEQARAAKAAGLSVDLAQFTRSDSTPGLYYALFDFASPRQVHKVLHRLVPSLEPHDDRLLVA